MTKEELEKELREIIDEGHTYISCSEGDIDLDYSVGERKCNLCLLALIAKNL